MKSDHAVDMMADSIDESVEAVESPEGVIELGEEMARLKAELDECKERQKELQAQYDVIRKERLPEAMQAARMVNDQGKGSFTLRDGRTVFLRTDLYASVRAADRDTVHEWLREHGHADLIRETVYAQTLKAFAREQIEQGAELPEQIVTYYETSASMRK